MRQVELIEGGRAIVPVQWVRRIMSPTKQQTLRLRRGRKGYSYTLMGNRKPNHMRPVVRQCWELLKAEGAPLTVKELADAGAMPLGSVYGAIREMLKSRTVVRHEPDPSNAL